jgi:transcription elongation factor Elf1
MKTFIDDAEHKAMSSEVTLDQSRTLLTHLHVCILCGHSPRREEVVDREISSGILHCPTCDSDGPLNSKRLAQSEPIHV